MTNTNIVPLFEQDLDYDAPPPPSQAECALWDSINGVILNLDHARGEQIPIRLGMVLHDLRTQVRAKTELRPDIEDVSRMLRSVEFARSHVNLFFDFARTYDANGDRGMDVLEGLICLWGETPEVRAARHPHVALDIDALADVFRRELRNADTMRAIEERAALRRSDRAAAVWKRLDEGAA